MGDGAPSETRAGEQICGRYVLGSLLGRGGHGEVYRARDLEENRDVAIKCLNPLLSGDSEYRLRLVREARAMDALAGLDTVKVFGLVGANDGTPCVVMEMLEGCNLLDAIKARCDESKTFSNEEVLSIFYPIVRTLDNAHAHDIIHRDIKPSNIFLVNSRSDDVRLMDFGLAKTGDLASITADQVCAGSPSYMAPEIWLGGARVADKRSDVYSLVCVIYQTFTGEPPIRRDSLAEMFRAVSCDDTRPVLSERRPDLPRALDEWVLQGLAVDPSNRFHNVVAMWRAFRSSLGR